MRILIFDDSGNTIYEQDNPGYIHLPQIFDGIYDISCEDNNCTDPRCMARREECEVLMAEWQRNGTELALAYMPDDDADDSEYERMEALPNLRRPKKVRIEQFSRNEVLLRSGERLPFLLPHLNAYSDDQVLFSSGVWKASLLPWRSERHDHSRH
jgi:hypothetical protein